MATTTLQIAVFLNGEQTMTSARTVSDLLAETGFGASKVATALNGEFLAERKRAETALKAGDHIEVVAPRQGG